MRRRDKVVRLRLVSSNCELGHRRQHAQGLNCMEGEQKSGTQRNQEADYFLTACITLVVCAHISSAQGLGGPFNLFPPYSFHVAGFAFISGYLYKASWDKKPLKYIKKRIRKLLLPSMAIYAIYGLICTILRRDFGFAFGTDLSLFSWLVLTFTSGQQFNINAAMWYVPAFFVAQVLHVLLRKLLIQFHIFGLIRQIIIIIAMFVSSYFAVNSGRTSAEVGISGARLAIVHVLFLFAWIIAGQQCRKYKEPLSRAPLWAVCLGAAAVALVAAYFSNGGTSYMLATGIFPNGYMLTMVATGAGIVLLLRLCLCAADLPIKPEKSSLLSERMARNSYSIMCHHIFGFFVLDAVFWMISMFTPFCQSFDVGLWRSTVWYTYCPRGITQFGVVYAAFGIAFSLGIHALWVRIQRRMKGWLRGALLF